jgi:5-methylthioadenosine/S-adenosylhomocysteine deaminase
MNADYIVYGDYVLTMNDALEVIKNGAVAVKDNKITAVGDAKTIFQKNPDARVIGGKGHVVMPGLINTHTHAAMVNLRGIADDLPLSVWLEKYIWPLEKKYLSPEYVFDGTTLACLEMLKGGTTTFADMYFYGDSVAEATKKVGLRALVGETVFDFPTAVAQNADEYLANAELFIKNWYQDELITPTLAPHSPYACSAETLKKTQKLAEKLNVPMQIHIAETLWEQDDVMKKYGKHPVTHLESIEFLGSNVIASHCVHLDQNEIAILAKRNVGVAHNVESNLKLASGFAPIVAMLKAGVKVGIGTDGAASNNDLNMFGELATVAKIHKAITNDPTALDAKTALLMATKFGAQVLGFSNLGYLAPKCFADIITIDMQKPHLLPLFDVYSHLVYAVNSADVANVMVNGKPLMINGMVESCNEVDIMAKAREWNRKLKESD